MVIPNLQDEVECFSSVGRRAHACSSETVENQTKRHANKSFEFKIFVNGAAREVVKSKRNTPKLKTRCRKLF